MASVINALVPYIKAGGSMIGVLGGIVALINLPQHNGPGIQNGLLTLVAGFGIAALGALFAGYAV
jgi:hypothetical protein